MRRAVRLALVGLIALAPSVALARGLGELNALTGLIVSSGPPAPADLDPLLEAGEAIALRDAASGLSPESITWAAALEKKLPASGPARARAERVLLALALPIAHLGGPEGAQLADPFYAQVLARLGVTPAEAKPRPALPRELAGIGRWADATARRLLGKLPAAEADPLRERLDFARGRYADAAAIARRHLASKAPDPRWHGWLAAALLSQGRPAAPHLAQALASGGEAAAIVLATELRRFWQLAATEAPGRLRAAGVELADASSPAALAEACTKLVDRPASPEVAKAIEPCAMLFVPRPKADWLKKAAPLAPSGAAGAPVRALAHLYAFTGAKSDAGRQAAWAGYLSEVKQLSLDGASASELVLARYLLRASGPAKPDAADRPLFDALSPCDARSLPFRLAVTPRSDQARTLDLVARRCAADPNGATAAASAFELLLYLSHRRAAADPWTAIGPLEPRIRALAAAHPDDPAALAAHADALGLMALSGKAPNRIGLEAALARYDEAIARSTPASGPQLARLHANAAYLSLALAEVPKTPKAARDLFLARSAHHLRIALAFGSLPAAEAIRARYDLDSGIGTVDAASLKYVSLVPPERGRARLACLLASEASARGDRDLTQKLLAQARPTASGVDLPALQFAREIRFDVRIVPHALEPLLQARSLLYLVPPCDPAKVALPSPAARR